MKMSLWRKAVLNAAGVLVYLLALTWLMNHAQNIFGTPAPSEWIIGTFMLLLFIISASITGSLVLGMPIILYLDGQRRRAVLLLGYTILSLVVGLILVGLGLFLLK